MIEGLYALNAAEVLRRFGSYEKEPSQQELALARSLEEVSASEAMASRTKIEQCALFKSLDWLLYNHFSEQQAQKLIDRAGDSVKDMKEEFAVLDKCVQEYEQVVRDIDGDLKTKINEYNQLQSLLHFYDLTDLEAYQVFEHNDPAKFLELVQRDGIQNVIRIFGDIEDAISNLGRGSTGNCAVVLGCHPEDKDYIQSYTLTRLRGLKMVCDTVDRTLERIMAKLASQIVPYENEAAAIMRRNFRDSPKIIEETTFLPPLLVHVKFRVMGRSILPITTMLKNRAPDIPDYEHHLRRLYVCYSAKRLRLVQSGFNNQIHYLMKKRKPDQSIDLLSNAQRTLRFWLDFANEEMDSLYFYFPQCRWVTGDHLRTLAADFYDHFRGYIISQYDMKITRDVLNALQNMSPLDDDTTNVIYEPISSLRKELEGRVAAGT